MNKKRRDDLANWLFQKERKFCSGFRVLFTLFVVRRGRERKYKFIYKFTFSGRGDMLKRNQWRTFINTRSFIRVKNVQIY